MSHKSRIESFDSVDRVRESPSSFHKTKLTAFLDDSKLHWGSVEHTAVGAQRKALFRQSLAESKLVLAARGGGLSSYRFFEAMSAGRVPVLFADDWELPHQNLIDWDKCIIHPRESDAKRIGQDLLESLQTSSNDVFALMGLLARRMWANYLAPAVWPAMMARCVEEKLR